MNCEACSDTGWIIVTVASTECAQRCECRTTQQTSQKFTPADLDRTLDKWSMLSWWPSHPRTVAEIKVLLAKIVPHKEALHWLTDQLVDNVGKWPGTAELRGILDCRYRPADGKPGWSSLPGFTPEEGEARYQQALPPTDAPLGVTASHMLRLLAGGKGMK